MKAGANCSTDHLGGWPPGGNEMRGQRALARRVSVARSSEWAAAGSVINPVFRSEYLNLLAMAGDVAVYQRLLIGRIVSHERSAVRIRRRRWSPAIRVDIQVRVRSATFIGMAYFNGATFSRSAIFTDAQMNGVTSSSAQ
jgi:pentapeptide repeat protein